MTQQHGSDSWVVAITNQKGGVGKTTLALALAAATTDSGGSALVVDVDPQSSSAEQAERIDTPGFDFVHETDPAMVGKLRQVRSYDAIYVDCPGSLEGFDVLAQVLANADFAIIPYENDPLSVRPTLRTARFCAKHRVAHKVLVNNLDPRLGADEVEAAWALLDEGGLARFRCFVRGYRAVPNALAARKTITSYKGKYAANVREDVGRVHGELLMDLAKAAKGAS